MHSRVYNFLQNRECKYANMQICKYANMQIIQEVTDKEGRRRFHGAFTGGYSAGYYNTVGSAEGWAPSTFKSSRDNRGAGRHDLIIISIYLKTCKSVGV